MSSLMLDPLVEVPEPLRSMAAPYLKVSPNDAVTERIIWKVQAKNLRN